ncbi:MAG: AAA family ATPase [bacterium]|nr:AAA family ATPase [bacterium]
MSKEFNVTGICIPENHYMVNTGKKLDDIFSMIERSEYFTINRPRQYGKTTTIFLLSKLLQERKEYLPIEISFEGIGSEVFDNEIDFIKAFLEMILDELEYLDADQKIRELVQKNIDGELNTLDQLNEFFTELVLKTGKKIVLMINKVDKNSSNQLFQDFLAMLRAKYLNRNEGLDSTFQSVILAGVHDVKNLNRPWNIAVNFTIDLSFNPEEIATMLEDYSRDKNIGMNIPQISQQIYYYTSGYPFLVSRLCKLIDEDIHKECPDADWTLKDIDEAVKRILQENNTNFESLIKNLENNSDLYDIVYNTIILGFQLSYNNDNSVIAMGTTYGIFKNEDGKVKIENRIYEQRIYNYLSSKIETSGSFRNDTFRGEVINDDGSLNFEKVLLKFQEFMKKEYSTKDEKFLETNGRLIFLAFLKPIINGYGFDFKEVQISEEKRLDVVITWLDKKHVIELKIWDGDVKHQKGLAQLCDYLDRLSLNRGFLVVFNFKQKKTWTVDTVTMDNKEIFMVQV